MYTYLLLSPKGSTRSLFDVKAAVELLKTEYCAECRGSFGFMGLVYATSRPMDPDHMATLGVIHFN